MEDADAWALRASHVNDGDWSLDQLLKLIDSTGLPFGLSVLTRGVVLSGMAVRVDRWAEHLDGVMDRFLGGAAEAIAADEQGLTIEQLPTAGSTAGDIEEWRANWPAKGWTSLVNQRRDVDTQTEETLAALQSDGPPPLSALPDDLAELVVRRELPAAALTLEEVSLAGLAGGPVSLPFVRVVVANIDAWWPRETDFSPPALG